MSDPLPKRESSATLVEQAVAAESAYYQQGELCFPTGADWTSWQRKQACYEVAYPTRPFPGHLDSSLYARHLLERHSYSLHHYMAYHLGAEAWARWFNQTDFVDPLLALS